MVFIVIGFPHDTAKVKLRRGGWVSRREERAFFGAWTASTARSGRATSHSVRRSRARRHDLHKRNVTEILKETHAVKRRIPVTVVGE